MVPPLLAAGESDPEIVTLPALQKENGHGTDIGPPFLPRHPISR